MLFHELTLQTNGETLRTATLEGKAHLVAPVTPIVAGVLNGELVTVSELEMGFQSWNGRPVTLDHPSDGSGYVSANSPEVLEQFGVGQLFMVWLDADRLRGEIWIDVEKATETPDGMELLDRMRTGEAVEVSTAYFRKATPAQGTFRGKAYSAKATDLKPDHLAMLLHSQGACSWADGCGVRANRELEDAMEDENTATLADAESEAGIVPTEDAEDVTANQEQLEANLVDEDGNEDPQPQYTWWERFKAGLRENLFGAEEDVSLEEQWDAVTSAFYSQLDSGQPIGDIGDGYVVRVYPEYIVVERTDGVLFRVDYTMEDGAVTFGEQTEGSFVFQPKTNEAKTEAEDADPETEEPTGNEADDDASLADDEEPTGDDDGETEAEDQDETAADDIEEDPDPDLEHLEADEAEDEDPEPESGDEPDEVEDAALNQSRCQEYVDLVDFADANGGPEWALNLLRNQVATKAEWRTNVIAEIVAEVPDIRETDLEEMHEELLLQLHSAIVGPTPNYSGIVVQEKGKVDGTEEPKQRKRIDLPPL